MIKRHYPANSKRALNVIWNAAADYDFDPPFLAFYPNGRPDLYFDMIIGLCRKHLDMDKISGFFESYGYARSKAEYDEFMWLGIENCVYEKEISERPALRFLRERNGEEFFKVHQNLSRQQMEMMSIPVYTQQQARWAFVTGRPLPLMSAREKAMYEALALPGALDTDEVIERLHGFLSVYLRFSFDPADYKKDKKIGIVKKLWGRYKYGQLKNTDKLIVRTGTGTGENDLNAVHLNQESGFKDSKKEAEDRAYIEGCFEHRLYGEGELINIEKILCREDDAGLRLWFADSGLSHLKSDADAYVRQGSDANIDSAPADSEKYAGNAESKASAAGTRVQREISHFHAELKNQRERNEKYLNEHGLQVRENIKKLSAELEVLISSYLKHLPEKAAGGKLIADKAYRLPLFNDYKIFLRDGDEAENNIRADILLDASQSRMNSQSLIASEAFIISESMMNAGVPVQVLSFRSLRGYTVIERLKAFDDRHSDGVLNYFSAGWNRDALALKAAGLLIEDELKKNSSEKHLLLVLTDASPNDSAAIAPREGESRGRNYEGLIPVEDARNAVKKLNNRGIRTAAVFHGASAHLENVYRIYGKEYVRIRSLAQLAGGLIDLLQMMLRETEA